MMGNTRRKNPENNKAVPYLFALLLSVVIASGVVLYLTRGSSATTQGGRQAGHRAFAGGKFEASGVTHVPGTDSVLFVDDGRPGEVFLMHLDGEGYQQGEIKAIKLGINIDDPEGITTDGTYFYIVSSQSRPAGNDQHGIVRFKLNPASQTVEAIESIGNLKQLLVARVSELRGMADRKAKQDGINIEGLAWDPVRKRLLLGLRSPLIEGRALAVALEMRDPSGPLSEQNISKVQAIRLPIGGLGIRSIEYDDTSKTFRIIAGATENQAKTDFRMWEWSGEETASAFREVSTFNRNLKPEGITRARVNGREFTFVVFDSSSYQSFK
jgi:hypothetical protein